MKLPSCGSFLSLLLAGALLLPAVSAAADSHDPADYPLRVHIYHVSNHAHRHRGMLWYVTGDGRANLYQNGSPAAIDFAFRCDDRFLTSEDYETLPARWKKPGYSLIVLTHVIGSDRPRTCEWKVDVKDFAIARQGGHVITEPAPLLAQWMAAHGYDPEHGRDQPTGLSYNADAHP